MSTRSHTQSLARTALLSALAIATFAPAPANAEAAAPAKAVPAASSAPAAAKAAAYPPSCPPLLRHTFPRLQDDEPQSLCQYAGKVLLVVNTASYCGFTGQYKGLEQLHQRFKERGFAVLGFPSNDFQQEAGTSREIADFCENTYGVKFPMFDRSSVRGPEASAFYRQLADKSGQVPRWNFYKYLVSRDGQVVASWSSMTSPDSRELVREVEKQLALPAPAAK
jgi:glutathione peroxidase